MQRLHTGRPHAFSRFRVLCLLACVVLWLPLLLNAEDGARRLRFLRISQKEGLIHTDIRALVVDKQGFLWIGTGLAGLIRHDSHESRVYVNAPDRPESINHNSVWSLLIDRKGRLWLGTHGGGLNLYDESKDSFRQYTSDAKNTESLPSDSILSLFEDSVGRLWVGSRAGLSLFDPESGKCRNFDLNTPAFRASNLNSVRSISEDPQTGLLWLSTSDGVVAFDPKTEGMQVFLRRPPPLPIAGWNACNEVLFGKDGLHWLVSEGGLLSFTPGIASIPAGPKAPLYPDFKIWEHHADNPRSLSSNQLRSGVLDREGKLWLGSTDGLNHFDPSTGECERYYNSSTDPSSISSNSIQRLMIDAQGHLWVGTNNAGLCRSMSPSRAFTTFRQGTKGEGLSTNAVTSLCFDQRGALWVGTQEGINSWDGKTWTAERHNPKDPNSLPPSPVTALCFDGKGQLWVGTSYQGLCAKDGDRFIRYERKIGDPDQIEATIPYSGDRINALYCDRLGRVWISARAHGLDLRQDNGFLHFPSYLADGSRSPTDNAIPGFLDDRGGLWFGSELRGLLRLDPTSREISRHYLDDTKPEAFANTNIYALHSDKGNRLWIGSITGLHLFDLEENKFVKSYHQDDGISGSAVVSILEDDSGRLWLGTSDGLTKLDTADGSFTRYTVADGLPSNQFVIRAAAKSPQGRLYFGTTEGIVHFSPQEIRRDETPPSVVLTEFSLNDKPVRHYGEGSPLDAPLNKASRILLKYDQSIFTLRFAAIDFSTPGNTRCEYRMEGFDQAWRKTDANNRSVTYTNLGPGKYRFRVRGYNGDGVPGRREAVIAVIIQPPWWGTLPFRVVVIGVVILAILGGYQWRVHGIKQRTRVLERLVAERTREESQAKERAEAASRAKSIFLASMSHELRTPLNGILGYAQILGKDRTLTERQASAITVIRQSGEHLLTLINDILDLSKIEAGKFEIATSDFHLPSFLQLIEDIIRIRAENKGLEFILDYQSALPAYLRADEKRLRQVLLNLLGNAIKYTDKGRVTLRIRVLDMPARETNQLGRIFFEVEDTGIGIDSRELEHLFLPFERMDSAKQRESGAGLGLAISRQIVRLMGGDIQVRSTPGRGSLFWFVLHVEMRDSLFPRELPPTQLTLDGVDPDAEGKAQDASEARTVPEHEAPVSVRLIPPPLAELRELHRLAERGSLGEIKSLCLPMAERKLPYSAFARKLLGLCDDFQSKAVLEFIKQHLGRAEKE